MSRDQEYEYKGWKIQVFWTNVMGGWWASAQDGQHKILERNGRSEQDALNRITNQIDKGGPFPVYHLGRSELQQLQDQCFEIRRIWQGPGQHSHELRRAVEELFALLPEEGPSLKVHVSDSLKVRSTFGGQ